MGEMVKIKKYNKVHVTNVKKKDKNWKEYHICQILNALSNHPRLFVLKYNDIENYKMTELRGLLRDKGKLYNGAHNIFKHAIKREKSLNHQDLHKILHLIKGNTALFFTKLRSVEVNEILMGCKYKEFIKVGELSKTSVELACGSILKPACNISRSLEPQLRKFGLPTRLNLGMIEVLSDCVINKHDAKI